MKPLNALEISRRVWIFAINFTFLLLVCILCVYTYFSIAEAEGVLLVRQANKYDQLAVRYESLSDQVDSIYMHMQLLNSDRVTNGLELQRLISNEKENLNKTMLGGVGDTSVNFVAYRNLSKRINNMLNIKDSIRLVSIDEEALRADLITCIDDNQQLKKKLKTPAPADELLSE